MVDIDVVRGKMDESENRNLLHDVSDQMLKYDSKPKTRMNEIMDLPKAIMVEILSRLPIKPIFRCKTVCKLWYHLLTNDPLFVNMYQTKSSKCILLSDGYTCNSILELKEDYDYHSCRRNRPIKLNPKFHLPPLEWEAIEPIGSCNGFIGWLNGAMYDDGHSIYINNPLLGEYYKLRLPEWKKNCFRYGFCFSEASRQYKVLRLDIRQDGVSELEIYTLGGVDEIWRNVGEAPYCFGVSLSNCNVNGVLHWIDAGNCTRLSLDSIFSFNIETEEVKSLPAPPGLETERSNFSLAELENCLCLADFSSSEHYDMWWMKEYGVAESWTKDRIHCNGIPRDIHSMIIPIIMWKDGEILMRTNIRNIPLVSYNPIKKMFREVKLVGSFNDAIRYIPSFYSLKTVMGDNFQASNVFPKTEIV